MQGFERKTVNKYEMQYWCKVYKVDQKTIIEHLGDKDSYDTEKLSELLFSNLKKAQ